MPPHRASRSTNTTSITSLAHTDKRTNIPTEHGGFGRWAFLEISDAWDGHKVIRSIFQLQVKQ